MVPADPGSAPRYSELRFVHLFGSPLPSGNRVIRRAVHSFVVATTAGRLQKPQPIRRELMGLDRIFSPSNSGAWRVPWNATTAAMSAAVFCISRRAAGHDPGAEADHGFGVIAQPVDRVAPDSQVDDPANGAFDGSAADRCVVGAGPGIIHPAVRQAVRDEVVQPRPLVLCLLGTDQRLDLVHDRPDFASQQAFLLSRQLLFLAGSGEGLALRDFAEVFHRVPESINC